MAKLLRLRRAGRRHLREPDIERDQIDPAEIAGERALGAATRDMCRHRAGAIDGRAQIFIEPDLPSAAPAAS